jgi:phosphatidate cytidylyltransferase
MQNLTSRLISAAIALILLFSAVYFWQATGVFIVGLFVVLRGSFEMARLFFSNDYPKYSKTFFVFLSFLSFLIITDPVFKSLAGLVVVLIFLLTVCYGIVLHKKFSSTEKVLTYVTKSISGLIYCCYLPACMIWITQTNNGMEWFFCLLAVVFSGDIGAYLFGVTMGKTKVAPLLSPKKSLEGALGGLLFSLLTAIGFSFLLINTPLWVFIVCGLLGGALGQIGDFFESLVKRIAGVKDSGTIMPGHGGVLDRLDGVLLASPLFYIASTYFSL